MSIDFLEKKNAHSRDKHITFDEGPHIYTIDGDSSFMSVTTWNHSHFEHFDADRIIANMMKSKKWPESKYFGMSSQEIKDQWSNNGKEASEAGTKMHYDIECYYNNIEVKNDSIEYQYFQNFEHDRKIGDDNEEMKSQLPTTPIPYRTEWMVYDKELKFAGSIDMLYEKPDGSLLIYDWKRSKGIEKVSKWNKFSTTECIEHLPDTNYWHYCLQLNTYKAIIEKNYGKKVDGMYLVCLHPENKNKNYQVFKVVDLREEVQDLFKLRMNNLKKSIEK